MTEKKYRWRVRARLPERFGQLCAILVKSRRMNSVLVEFEDGYRVVTSINYVRLVHGPVVAESAIGDR